MLTRYSAHPLPKDAVIGPGRLIADRHAAALARLDERIAHSPVVVGFLERNQFADACASLWIEGEIVHLEDLVLHDASQDIRTPDA